MTTTTYTSTTTYTTTTTTQRDPKWDEELRLKKLSKDREKKINELIDEPEVEKIEVKYKSILSKLFGIKD